jgi:hypothetical protein
MTTLEQLTLFEDSLISLSAGFPVNLSRRRESRKVSPTIAISSPNSSESFATFDREGRLLRMCQGYCQSTLDGHFQEYFGSLPKQGMTLSGTLFHAPGWVVSTCEKDYGLLPTPVASDKSDRKPGNPHLTKNGTIRHLNKQGQQSFMRLGQVVKLPSIVPSSGLLPTPTASDATTGQIIGKDDTFRTTATGALRKVNRHGTDGSIGLGRLVQMLPTPTASNALNGNGYQRDRNGNVYPTLSGAVGAASLPTPTANDAKNLSLPPSQKNRDSIVGALLATPTVVDANNNYRTPTKGGRNLSYETGCGKKAKLNPDFVAAMMGFPPGWLDPT